MDKFIRRCPVCQKEITYSNKYNHQKAVLKKSKCKSCGIKESITDERLKEMSERVKGKNNPMYGMSGELNPFFGKKHTHETKKKILENRDITIYQTDEFKKKISKVTKGNKNPMFGRSIYSVWVEKYGENIAVEKMKEYKLKQSKNNSGEKNAMYGKPSPKGSGNGWSGWYKGWYFRSLKELSYMVKVIERFNLVWETAETKEFTIKYKDHNHADRTYTADFIIDNKYMVEIKPKKLWNSKLVKLKESSAVEFCKSRGLKYKLTDITKLSKDEISMLWNKGLIKFIDRYEKKFTNYQ